MTYILPIRNLLEYKTWVHNIKNIVDAMNNILEDKRVQVAVKIINADYIELVIFDAYIKRGEGDGMVMSPCTSLLGEDKLFIFQLKDDILLKVINNRKVIPDTDYSQLCDTYSNLIRFTDLNKEYNGILKNEKEKLEYLIYKYTYDDELINDLEAEAKFRINSFLKLMPKDDYKLYITIKDKIFIYPKCFTCDNNKAILKEWINKNKLEPIKLDIYSTKEIEELKVEFNILEKGE